jgi:hypothetical protein
MISWVMMALIIVPTTKNQSEISKQVMTQPMTCIACDLNALPIAKVAVTRAVFGKTNENQVMANGSRSRTQDQCAPTETKNQKRAKLEIVSSHYAFRSMTYLPP